MGISAARRCAVPPCVFKEQDEKRGGPRLQEYRDERGYLLPASARARKELDENLNDDFRYGHDEFLCNSAE